MSDSPKSAVVDALRVAFEQPLELDPSEILVQSVEDMIFRMRVLAPPDVVTGRALHEHLQSGPINASDEAAFEDWEASVAVKVEQFLTDPVAATSVACDDFIEACGRVFGIESDTVPLLLRHFSSLTESQRIGIFLSIERSTAFSFLTRLIDSALLQQTQPSRIQRVRCVPS